MFSHEWKRSMLRFPGFPGMETCRNLGSSTWKPEETPWKSPCFHTETEGNVATQIEKITQFAKNFQVR